jgi:hypothetical protein
MRAALTRYGFGVLVIVLATGAAHAQQLVYWFNGVPYVWPSAHAVGALRNDGKGVLVWAPGMTGTMLAFTTAAVCPPGWIDHIAGHGRYLVGLALGGTPGATVGTALEGIDENRLTGEHLNHAMTTTITLTDPTHAHVLTDPGHVHGGTEVSGSATGANFFFDSGTGAGCCNSTTSVTTGASVLAQTHTSVTASGAATVGVGGSTVAGTNAPYLPLKLCEKL